MWTHAEKMWTDANCHQKCGQMWTINANSTQTRSMQNAKSNGMVQYHIVHLQSDEREKYFEAIKLVLVNDPARVNFLDTAYNCGQKMWTDADCPQ
jgi:hypothetical protein